MIKDCMFGTIFFLLDNVKTSGQATSWYLKKSLIWNKLMLCRVSFRDKQRKSQSNQSFVIFCSKKTRCYNISLLINFRTKKQKIWVSGTKFDFHKFLQNTADSWSPKIGLCMMELINITIIQLITNLSSN